MKEEKMIVIGMYADQTGLYTEDELAWDNWCELEIPERIVRQWYEENGLAKGTAWELGIRSRKRRSSAGLTRFTTEMTPTGCFSSR